jgi:hypothetical protein
MQLPSREKMNMGYLKYKQSLNKTSTNAFHERILIPKKINRNLSQKRTRNPSKHKILVKQKSSSPQIRVPKKSIDIKRKKEMSIKENSNIKKIMSLNKFFREKTNMYTEDREKSRKRNQRFSLRKLIRHDKVGEKKSINRNDNLPYTMIRKLGKGSYAYVYLGNFFRKF